MTRIIESDDRYSADMNYLDSLVRNEDIEKNQ